MKMFHRFGLFTCTVLILSFFLAQEANARGGASGNMALGVGISTVSANQADINGAIDDAISQSAANTKNLGSAWEFYANWSYRFSGTMYAVLFRPSYFMQSTTGSGTGGSFDYSLNGFTLFPMFRLYPLENAYIKFFMQTGLGYGNVAGSINAGAQSLNFKGSAFGAMGGIGVDFCFTPSHCVSVEGNLRYMPIERNLTSGGNCTDGSIPGISQCGGGSEVERNGADLQTTLSGVQGLIGYTMNF